MKYLYRAYPDETPLEGQELEEFNQLLSDRPELRRAYKDFKTLSHQQLRSRIGRSPWLDVGLDKVFELAAAGEENLEEFSDTLDLSAKERRGVYKEFGRRYL